MHDTILNFTGAEDDGGGGDNWSYKTCKAPVKSSIATNQHPAFYRLDALHVTQSRVSEHKRVNVSHSSDLLTPSTSGGFSPCPYH